MSKDSLRIANPSLASEWHPTKNGTLTPYDVTPGSSKKVWWKCPEGDDHVWQSSVSNRTKGRGCPICSGRSVAHSTSLAILDPELAKEWHPTKNGALTPYDVGPGSGIKVWWKCPAGNDHEWETSVRHRTHGTNCPICSGNKVVPSTSLATLNPDLAKEWHPIKNGNLTPFDVRPASNKIVWWKCPAGDDHEWKTAVAHRIFGKGCPICSGHKVAPSTSLATLNPDLAKEWHPTKNRNLRPSQVSPGSGKKVWWKCEKGDDHEWESSVSNRAKGSGCPVCANMKVGKFNSLEYVYPELAKDWHPTKNGTLTPKDVVYGSHKKVWWQCSKGKNHVWKTSPSRRVVGTNCPFCTNPSSKPELRILAEIRTIFPSTQHRVYIKGFEVDIYIPEIKIGIEYDGEYWHRNKKKQDLEKNKALDEEITLIRVRERGLPILSESDIEVKSRSFTLNTMKEIFQRILDLRQIKSQRLKEKISSYQNIKRWVAPKEFRVLLAAREQINFKDSLAFLYPEIAKQWHPTKNAPLLPDYFTPGSNKRVWWKCTKVDDHEWESQIAHRCLRNTNCPICSNNKIVLSNCLATLDPKLSSEWHPTKNGKLTPYDVGLGSNKKVWWKCPKGTDHEWKTSTIHRTERGTGCPVCANKKIVKSNCLATLNPELAKEWHSTKNHGLTPFDVGIGSNKSVWWKCPKGDDHEWKSVIVTRHNGIGCPICSNQKIVKSNSLATLNPELSKEWHPTKNGKLTPHDLGPGSGKKVWWKCSRNEYHEWKTSIRNRHIRGHGCPKCRSNNSGWSRGKIIDKDQLKLF